MNVATAQLLDWGMATATLAGEAQCGDQCLVQPFERGVLVAVVDGLGHGVEASHAAVTAVNALADQAELPLLPLIQQVHASLRGTRGVVLSLARFEVSHAEMSWLGVGDVEGVLLRPGVKSRESLLLRGGVVGYQLPPLRESVVSLETGDVLVFATDGIRSSFTDTIDPTQSPQQIADATLANCQRGTDDALVLAVRYLGCLT